MISKVKPVVEDTGDKSDWFEGWFNSPYYEILYKNHNVNEAENFLDAIITHINLKPGIKVLDVACGKGRHSVYMNKKGFEVTGLDLSESNILNDKQFENESLTFYLHDMREVFRANYFDVAINFFSSFGYFDRERDNFRCIQAISTSIKNGGTFVFDYINAGRVRDLIPHESQLTIEGINFQIKKFIENGFIKKQISISDQGKIFNYTEQLALLDKDQIEKYFNQCGLIVIDTFGNYQLEKYDHKKSERLIMIAKKPKQP